MAILLVTISTGCTHTAAHRTKVENKLAEESRALTTAVVDTLQLQPSIRRDTFTATALDFAKQNQRVQGLPLKPFNVPALFQDQLTTEARSLNNNSISTITNSRSPNIDPSSSVPSVPLWLNTTPAAVQRARSEVATRFRQQDSLLAESARLETKLIALGEKAEEARNARITRWTKWGLSLTTILGGLVALFVFCPLALPIAGRLLAWIVGKIPALASWCGVVSVKAFDAVVRGIENAKKENQTADGADIRRFPESKSEQVAPTVPLANSPPVAMGDSRRGLGDFSASAKSAPSAVKHSSPPPSGWIDQLHTSLSREMDSAHKALVRSRKAGQGQQ